MDPVARRRLIIGPTVRRFTLALAVMALAACSGGGVERGDEGITDGGDLSVFELQPGDCLYPPEAIDENVDELPVVPCNEVHTHEVFAVWEAGDPEAFAAADELDIDVYPGEAALDAWAERACIAAFPTFVGGGYFDADLFSTYLLPTLDSWGDGDRDVVCVARTTGWVMATSVHCSGGQRGTLEVPGDAPPEPGALADAYRVPVGEPCPDVGVTTDS